MPSRTEVADFLRHVKTAIEFGPPVHFVPRERTDPDLILLNLTRTQATDIVAGLTPDHYSSGPHPDDTDATKEVWIFGYQLDGVLVYIKLRLVPADKGRSPRLVIWSFHKADSPLKFPLKGASS